MKVTYNTTTLKMIEKDCGYTRTQTFKSIEELQADLELLKENFEMFGDEYNIKEIGDKIFVKSN